MKRLVLRALVSLMLVLTVTSGVSADTPLVGGCPDQFQLHEVMPHDEHHGHKLVGSDTDRNADGLLCVKHVSADEHIHVHIDNTVPSS
jgi:hypothetical protein